MRSTVQQKLDGDRIGYLETGEAESACFYDLQLNWFDVLSIAMTTSSAQGRVVNQPCIDTRGNAHPAAQVPAGVMLSEHVITSFDTTRRPNAGSLVL